MHARAVRVATQRACPCQDLDGHLYWGHVPHCLTVKGLHVTGYNCK